MARIRTIKPQFWTNEELSQVSEPACLLAIALLNYADDEGFFNANAKLIESSCFPLRELSVNIHGAITELSNIGYIQLGKTTNGRSYGKVVNFLEHQRINRPNKSQIVDLQIVWNESKSFTEHSLNAHGAFTDGIRNKEGNKEMEKEGNSENKFSSPVKNESNSLFTEGKEKEKSSAKKEKDEPLVYPFDSEKFMQIWEVFIGLPKQKIKPHRSKQMMLKALSEFDEEFAIKQIELAIQNNWQGLVFADTKEKYLNSKKGIINHGGKQQINAGKFDALDAFAALAGDVVQAIDSQNR